MNKIKLSFLSLVVGGLIINPIFASAAGGRGDNRQDNRKEQREVRHSNKTVRGKHVIVVPRHRMHRNIVVVRPHGHAYIGYGHYHNDNDAWRWLAFTAITLKILDNLNEDAQRQHESAQVKATTAAVGEKITWDTPDSSGYVVTTKEGKNTSGLTCREFQQEITVAGKTENAYGTACLQADGSWEIVS